MQRLIKLIEKLGSIRWFMVSILFLIVASFLIYGSWLGTAGLAKVSGGHSMLDVGPAFTVEEAYTRFEQMGEEGRAFYIRMMVTSDLFFPFAYGFFGMVVLAMVYKKGFEGNRRLGIVLMVPIAAALMDYLENLLISIMLNTYPERLVTTAVLANLFHMMKGVFGFASIVLLIWGIVRILNRKLTAKRSANP